MTDEHPPEESFTLPISEPQPSQLLLNGRKLSLASQWFDFDEPSYDPIPVVELDGEWVLTDGHTRAFLAHLAGAEELVVRQDPDEADLPLDLYRRCVSWCRADGVTRVADLSGRVVDADSFEERWVARCHAAAEKMDEGADRS